MHALPEEFTRILRDLNFVAVRPCAFFSRHFFSPNLRGRAEKTQNAQRKKHWLSVPDYLTDKGHTELVLSAVIFLFISLPNNDSVKPVATKV